MPDLLPPAADQATTLAALSLRAAADLPPDFAAVDLPPEQHHRVTGREQRGRRVEGGGGGGAVRYRKSAGRAASTRALSVATAVASTKSRTSAWSPSVASTRAPSVAASVASTGAPSVAAAVASTRALRRGGRPRAPHLLRLLRKVPGRFSSPSPTSLGCPLAGWDRQPKRSNGRQETLEFLYESELGVGKGSSDGFQALQQPRPAAAASSFAPASATGSSM